MSKVLDGIDAKLIAVQPAARSGDNSAMENAANSIQRDFDKLRQISTAIRNKYEHKSAPTVKSPPPSMKNILSSIGGIIPSNENTQAVRAEQESSGAYISSEIAKSIGPLVAVAAGRYFPAACLLINGTLGIPIAMILLVAVVAVVVDGNSHLNAGAIFVYFGCSLIPVAMVSAGFGTIKGKRWARVVGFAICVLITAASIPLGLMVGLSFYSSYFYIFISKLIYAFALAVTFASSAGMLATSSYYWIARSRPSGVCMFVGFVLLIDVPTVNFILALALDTLRPNPNFWVWPAFGALLAVVISLYCIIGFYRQFGPSIKIGHSVSQS